MKILYSTVYQYLLDMHYIYKNITTFWLIEPELEAELNRVKASIESCDKTTDANGVCANFCKEFKFNVKCPFDGQQGFIESFLTRFKESWLPLANPENYVVLGKMFTDFYTELGK